MPGVNNRKPRGDLEWPRAMPSMKRVRLLPLPVGGGAGDNSEGSLSNQRISVWFSP